MLGSLTRVGEALDAYVADRMAVVASPDRLASSAAPIYRHLGRVRIGRLGDHCGEYLRRRTAEGVSPQTVRRELITLRAAVRMAWRTGRIRQVPHISLPQAGSPRQRTLQQAEIERLRRAAAANPDLAVCVDILLGTGARIGAVLELTWDRVDLVSQRIDFRAPHPMASRRKNRAVVPISSALAERLRKHRHRYPRRPQVVALSRYQLYRRFRPAVKRAGLEGVTPHVLRHTVATHLLRNVRLVEASRMLGHRSVAITEQVYGHLTVDDLSSAAASLETLLG